MAVTKLGKLQIIDEISRVTGLLTNPTWGSTYSVGDVLVGEKYIYVMHMNFNYVSQYNKNPDGTIGSRVRTNSWYSYDSFLDYLSNNNSSVPYAYAMYIEGGEDYLIGWSKSHSALFRWRIDKTTNRPVERTQYNVASRVMSPYGRGGWDGDRYVYFYNPGDLTIYRWDILNKTTSMVSIVKITNSMSLSSSWTGSGMLVDAARGEVYWGSGGDVANGFLGAWSLATGQPLAGTPRNPLKGADLTSLGISLLSGEAGNITLTAIHRNIAYYFHSYSSTIVQLRLGWIEKYPANIKVVTPNISLVTGEEVTVSWDAAAYYENILEASTILYQLQVKYDTTWITVVTDIIETEYTYNLPNDVKHTTSLVYRVLVRSEGYGESYNTYDTNVVSPVRSLYRHLFFVSVDDKVYTFTNGDWLEIIYDEEVTRDIFLQQGLTDLDIIPSDKWDELGDNVSIISYVNEEKKPMIDVTTQEAYEPIYLLNEKLSISNPIVRSYAVGKSPMTLNRYAVPKRQLIFPTGDIKLYSPTIPEAVVGFNLTANESAGTMMRIMFSIDEGVTYLSWDGTQWNSYTDIVDDEESEDLMQQHGMTIDVLNALTKDQLGEIFGYEPRNRIVRFVYLYEMNHVNDDLQSGELKISLDMHGSWRQAKEADFTYGYPTNTELHVQLFTSGSYKINGLLYGDTEVIV